MFGIPPVAFGPAGPDTGLEVARARALIDAAAAAGIEQIVFSTVASASTTSPSPAGKALIEQYLHDYIALPTVLRPVRFMTNYLGSTPFGIDGITGGVHRHIFPPPDPARFAGRTLELAGATAIRTHTTPSDPGAHPMRTT